MAITKRFWYDKLCLYDYRHAVNWWTFCIKIICTHGRRVIKEVAWKAQFLNHSQVWESPKQAIFNSTAHYDVTAVIKQSCR